MPVMSRGDAIWDGQFDMLGTHEIGTWCWDRGREVLCGELLDGWLLLV